MSLALITGSAGLVGSEATRHFSSLGWDVVGLDNDMRRFFFGEAASTRWMAETLIRELPNYRHYNIDIRSQDAITRVLKQLASRLDLVIHAAAQPSHDWAARQPMTDFGVNAIGTLNLLEGVRRYAPSCTFIYMSTNKVYGDTPNCLPLLELPTRYELPNDHMWFPGIPETMSIDFSTHSLFGVSKASADLLVQEYGRYFGIKTVVFRGGCLTGPGHSAAELHGFLGYLMKAAVTGIPYTVYGYKGKQVRDNIHAADLAAAFEHVARNPRSAAVYNIGGGRYSNCSLLEAIHICHNITGRIVTTSYVDTPRTGDHMWWISDTSRFRADYPDWGPTFNCEDILTQIYEQNHQRWLRDAPHPHKTSAFDRRFGGNSDRCMHAQEPA